MDTSTLNYSLIHPGSMIGYRLLPSQLPVHPRKIWLGKVIRLHTPTLFTVEIIEPGYYGLQEYVRVEQIAQQRQFYSKQIVSLQACIAE